MWMMSRLGAGRRELHRASVVLALVLALPVMAVLGDVSGLTATASAFSRAGLPVEYLDVYSAAMGRNIRVQYQPGTAPVAAPDPGTTPSATLEQGSAPAAADAPHLPATAPVPSSKAVY